MADYIAQSRSNYFRVRNPMAFRRFCRRYRVEVITKDSRGRPKRRHYGFMFYEAIPSGHTDANNEWVESDFMRELAGHLVRGEVAVVMEIGSEKMRYLNGYACAVNWKGRRIEVVLTDIYRRAKETFRTEPTVAEY